jgi:hypothetical protein
VQYFMHDRDRSGGPGGPSAYASLRRGLALLVQVAGLFATGWMIWISSVQPQSHRYSWASLAGSALGYAVFAWAWSILITFGLYLTIPRRERGDAVWATLRTSTTAVWFAPAIILLTQMSPAALAAALVLVISATRLIYTQWRVLYPRLEAAPAYAPMDLLFGEGEPAPLLIRELMPALAVSLCLQSGIMAMLLHVPLLAGALFAMSASVATVFAISSGASDAGRTRDLPRSVLGVVLTVLLAAGMTIGGMSGRVMRHSGAPGNAESGREPDPVESTRALLRELFYGEQPPDAQKAQETPPSKDAADQVPKLPQDATTFPDGSYPGVILEPEVKPVTRLVAPVAANRGLSGATPRPYSILFGGDYWMFRWPYRRPPQNSYYRKGNPSTLSFSTTDHWPLMMEAHQRLDQPIDLNCCRQVQVEIRNADRYPGTVSLELYAMATDSPGAPATSLGSAQVHSAPDLKRDPVAAVPEILEFTITEDEALAACNELKVVFRRDRSRADKSARVAVERFVLVPK